MAKASRVWLSAWPWWTLRSGGLCAKALDRTLAIRAERVTSLFGESSDFVIDENGSYCKADWGPGTGHCSGASKCLRCVVVRRVSADLSEREVSEKIQAVGGDDFNHYAEAFLANGIDGKTAFLLTDEDLIQTLNIRNAVHRKRIINEFQLFRPLYSGILIKAEISLDNGVGFGNFRSTHFLQFRAWTL